jgi:two-component system sensor histidine kinase YesM
MEKKRFHSLWPRTLRAQLGGLLAVFWLIPLILLSVYTFWIYRQNVASGLRSTMDSRIYYAALLTNERLTSAVDASRNVTYDKTLQTYQDDYSAMVSRLSGEGAVAEGYPSIEAQLEAAAQQLSTECTNYLNNQFVLNNDFSLAVMTLDVLPDAPFFSDRVDQSLFNYYTTFVAASVEKMRDALGNGINFVVHNEHLYLVRTLRRTDNSGAFGTLVLELNTDAIFEFLIDASGNDGPFYVQLNQSQLMLRGPDSSNAQPPVITQADSGVREEAGLTLFSGWFPGRDYTFAYQVPITNIALYGAFNSFHQVLIVLAIVSVGFFFMIFRSFQRRFAQPLESLSNAAWALKSGDLGVHAHAPRQDDEIGELVQSFNAMSDQMLNLFNRVYREQLALKDARIMALQSQINPHFFNNTLELMNWKARMLGDEQLSQMIQALSTLLDASMDRKNTRFIPLDDELKVADAYLTIIAARFGRRITIEKQVDQSRLDAPVPRMILQPLLENAVIHGLEPAGGGMLILQVTSHGADLHVAIINEGRGLTDADYIRIQDLLTKPIDPADPKSQRLGIRNVHERLRLIYGDASGLTFRMDAQKRTVCAFVLPPPPPDKEEGGPA